MHVDTARRNRSQSRGERSNSHGANRSRGSSRKAQNKDKAYQTLAEDFDSPRGEISKPENAPITFITGKGLCVRVGSLEDEDLDGPREAFKDISRPPTEKADKVANVQSGAEEEFKKRQE